MSLTTPVAHTRAVVRRVVLAVLAAAALAVVVAPGVALGGQTRLETSTFDGSDTDAGAFADLRRVAVHRASGAVFAIDVGASVVDKFDSSGVAQDFSALGTSSLDGSAIPAPDGPTTFSLYGDSDVAVDNSGTASDGNVTVLTAGQQTAWVFDATGAYLHRITGFGDPCGAAVDSEGHVWISDYTASAVIEYDAAGTATGNTVNTSAQGPVCHIAFDSSDNLYGALYNGSVEKYDSTGAHLGQIDDAPTLAVSVDPVSGHIFAAHSDRVSEYDSADALVAEFDQPNASGVAVGNAGEVYVSSWSDKRVHLFGPLVTIPDATTGSATDVATTTATLNGSVDPDGVAVTDCHFEYVAEADFQADGYANATDVACSSDPGSGSGSVDVAAQISGLTRGRTTYHYRLVATNASGSTQGSDQTLVTLGAAIDSQASQYVDLDSATLTAKINPNGQSTTYHFEYGTDTGYGHSTPETLVGSNTTAHLVSAALSGLTPGTTYHWRAVATNAADTATGPDRTFTTGATAPEARGYEMVSPPDKNFGDVAINKGYFADIAVAHNGEAASFCTTASFGPTGGAVCGDYVSHRDAADQRWEATPVVPPYCTIDNTDPDHRWSLAFKFQNAISVDMRKAVSWLPEGGGGCPFAPLDPFAPTPSLNLYLFDDVGNPASARLVAPQPAGPDARSALQTPAGSYAAGSDDLSHIVFSSTGQQTPEVPADGRERLWEWANGTVRLVEKDPANVPFTTHVVLPDNLGIVYGTPPFRAFDRFNAVSADGSRIFFVNSASGGDLIYTPADDVEIYMRENGTTTHRVSESECTSACGPPAADVFRYATPDGDKVLFASAERLTDEPTPSGVNLYMYTHSADPASDQNLTLLTRDEEPADGTMSTTSTTINDYNRVGVVGTSDDGDDVYFVTEGQLVSGGPTEAVPYYVYRLYRWRANGGDPELSFLANLSNEDKESWSSHEANRNRFVTPDGEHLLLQTAVTLDPIADHNVGVGGGVSNVPAGFDAYRWSEDAGWTCLSCAGAGGSHGGFVGVSEDVGLVTQTFREQRPISDDGSRVVFQSKSAFVPRDTNHQRDVYVWDDGTVRLVSSGKSPDPSVLAGASADGDDIFFTTRERLVGWDTDNNSDLYDARVGGGFPEPPVSPAPCAGDECQNPPVGPPVAPDSGSADFNGSGNVGGGARSSISGVRGLSASGRASLAAGGKARLRLKVNRAGRVTVVGRAKVGRKRSRVVSSSARARKAGAVSVPFALSKGARAELRRKGSLEVTLTVRFRDARPQALTFTVKSATSKRGRR